MKKKILIALLAIFVVIQFISFKVDEDTTANKSILEMHPASEEVAGILQRACFDCHSNQTNYPLYARIAPVSWYIENHVNEGKEHLNFAAWDKYSSKKADHKLEECIEEVKEGEMPLEEYTWLHSEAKLSNEEKSALLTWFSSVRSNY